MDRPLYQALAALVDARLRCIERFDDEWCDRHEAAIIAMCREHLPSGSGLDLGPVLDLDASRPERLVFARCDFHHMSEYGYYDGWTEHTVVVTPSLPFGFRVRVTGRNRNDVKDYIAELFDAALRTPMEL